MKIHEKIGLYRDTGQAKQILRIMKLTILIMTICLIQVSALTKAQISLNEKKVPLQKVLESISTQSGYDFIYSEHDFKGIAPITIKLNNVSIEAALKTCFAGQPLIYEVSDKTVMVKKKTEESFIELLSQLLETFL